MKVFLNASPRGDKEYGSYYKKIHEELKRLGYKHMNDDAVTVTSEDFSKDMEEGGREAQVDLYERNIKGIKQADICVFETSVHSLTVGFLVNKALESGKPTIVLFYRDNIPYFISGIDDDKLIVKEYNEKNVKKIVKEAIDIARERRDKRFNFFISPKLLDYLERASTNEGVTKSKFIRNLIMNHMRDKKEYGDVSFREE